MDCWMKPTMFTPILMTFGGDDLATRQVAETIAATFRAEGLATEVRPLDTVATLDGFGMVVVGGPFDGSRWDDAARAFLVANRAALIAMPVAVFATGTGLDGPDGEVCNREGLLEELAQLRWLHPIAADMFCMGTRRGLAASNGHGVPPDQEAAQRWARLVAQVLLPAAMR